MRRSRNRPQVGGARGLAARGIPVTHRQPPGNKTAATKLGTQSERHNSPGAQEETTPWARYPKRNLHEPGRDVGFLRTSSSRYTLPVAPVAEVRNCPIRPVHNAGTIEAGRWWTTRSDLRAAITARQAKCAFGRLRAPCTAQTDMQMGTVRKR